MVTVTLTFNPATLRCRPFTEVPLGHAAMSVVVEINFVQT